MTTTEKLTKAQRLLNLSTYFNEQAKLAHTRAGMALEKRFFGEYRQQTARAYTLTNIAVYLTRAVSSPVMIQVERAEIYLEDLLSAPGIMNDLVVVALADLARLKESVN